MDPNSQYAESGVDINAGQRATQLMSASVRSTYTPAVLSDLGSFGGLYSAIALKDMESPVLVASTDGVGTKTRVAARMGIWNTIGADLVNHCVNDILVQGAMPLFFLDYVASDKLNPEQIAEIVSGMADACYKNGCALIGGETAEMPGIYTAGEVDIAGTIVGVVERAQLIDGSQIQTGDAIIGLPSSGLHTNGYSLARHILSDLDWSDPHVALDSRSIGEILLAVHRSYLDEVQAIRARGIEIKGMAHITGGGIIDNLPRILPDGVQAHIQRASWQIPAIFNLIQKTGSVTDTEMFRVFNMGLGLLMVCDPVHTAAVISSVPDAVVIGQIKPGDGKVILE